jgi:hypothetical protein
MAFSKVVTEASLIFQAFRNFSWMTESKEGFEDRNQSDLFQDHRERGVRKTFVSASDYGGGIEGKSQKG